MSAVVARNSLTALITDLRRRVDTDSALAPFVEKLEQIDHSALRFDSPGPVFGHQSMRFLAPALTAAMGDPQVLAATRAVAQAIRWYQIYQGKGIDPALAEGMLAGQIVGQNGILDSKTLRAGLFLLAPGIHYPLHTHAAAEIYYSISGRLTLQYGVDGAPFDLTPGNYSVTPENRLHSLATGTEPVLMLYIWITNVDMPNWWWEKTPAGGWQRAKWSRNTDGSWFKASVEPVSDGIMREAHP